MKNSEIISERTAFMRLCAEEGMVLLKNENNNLPLGEEKVALFGRSQIDTVKGGTGSGFVYCEHTVSVLEGIRNSGINYYEPLADKYENWVSQNPKDDGNGSIWGSGMHCTPEMPLHFSDFENAAAASSKAIVVIGRISGENYDMKDEKGDYRITDEEEALISSVCEYFDHVILVLNTGGPIDVSFLEKYNIETVLYMGQGGEEGGNALASILKGEASPSGKLSITWAGKYEKYPCHDGFFGEEVVYNEGIYVGYRYFDSFGIDPVFPFGFGLGYTDFGIKTLSCSLDGSKVMLNVRVTNIGKASGKETVQVYTSSPERILEKPYQELRAFSKTRLLEPGESEEIKFSIDLSELASYYTKEASYILEYGDYIFRVGNSSRNTIPVLRLTFGEGEGYAVTAKLSNVLTPEKDFEEIKKPFIERSADDCEFSLTAKADEIKTVFAHHFETENPAELVRHDPVDRDLFDVKEGRATLEEVVAQMTDEELARFSNGYTETDEVPDNEKGEIVGASSRTVMGAAGETWFSNRYKMPSSVVADGPAGVRLNLGSGDNLRYCSAFPIGMLLAGSWNEDTACRMGRIISGELKRYGIDAILGPGINIVKNPLCGRTFEYFSEDPLLAGKICAAEVRGVQTYEDGSPSGTYATIKHFAANQQENFRTVGNSVVNERTMREIYLKAFEIAVKEAQPFSIMTSYNKLNGCYTPARFDLCSTVGRGEWGFQGMYMTDWGSRADASACMRAGNDLIMAGWLSQYIYNDLVNGKLDRASVQRSVVNILRVVMKTESFRKLCEDHNIK